MTTNISLIHESIFLIIRSIRRNNSCCMRRCNFSYNDMVNIFIIYIFLYNEINSNIIELTISCENEYVNDDDKTFLKGYIVFLLHKNIYQKDLS